MSQRFIDCFDYYTEITRKWTATINSGAIFPYAGGRNGGGYFLGQGLLGAGLSKTIDYQSTWIVGWAFKIIPSFGVPFGNLYQLYSGGGLIMSLNINNDSTLSIVTGGNNTTYGFTTESLNEDTWYYLEIKNVLVAGWGITTTVRINGNTVLLNKVGVAAPSGYINSDSSKSNRHQFGSPGTPNGGVIDDVYINDGQGTKNNDFNGDCVIGFVVADADSATNWSIHPTTPTPHYRKINEVPSDDDTTYIFSNTLGDVDTFEFQPIASFTGTVHGIQITYCARKDDEGYRAFTPIVGSTEDPNPSYVNDSYKFYLYNYDDDNGTDWSVAQFNGEKFGLKLVV